MKRTSLLLSVVVVAASLHSVTARASCCCSDDDPSAQYFRDLHREVMHPAYEHRENRHRHADDWDDGRDDDLD